MTGQPRTAQVFKGWAVGHLTKLARAGTKERCGRAEGFGVTTSAQTVFTPVLRIPLT